MSKKLQSDRITKLLGSLKKKKVIILTVINQFC